MIATFGYKSSIVEYDSHKTISVEANLDYLAMQIKRDGENITGNDLADLLENYNLYGIFRDAIDELYTENYRG